MSRHFLNGMNISFIQLLSIWGFLLFWPCFERKNCPVQARLRATPIFHFCWLIWEFLELELSVV